jgi:hypothetical protein
LAHRAGTTTLGCHAASLLVICAITAAQLRTIGGIAAEKGFDRFRKTVLITFFRFCLVINALSSLLLSRFFSAKLSRNTFAYLSMALRPAFFLSSSNSPTMLFTAFNKFFSPFSATLPRFDLAALPECCCCARFGPFQGGENSARVPLPLH